MEFRSKPKKPDIICFGDSLTVGYQSPTADNPEYRETPYGDYLQYQLGQNHWVVISGLNGELTTGMVNRFRRDVLEHLPRYVIILGGSNDLGWNRTPSDIFTNLAMMYDQAQAGGITPIAVTVPSFRPLQLPDFSEASELPRSNRAEWQMIHSHIERRLELNGRIQEYCVSKKIPCVDLFSETAEADSKLLALSYSNDGLHLSTAGYKLLADLLWNNVFQG
ncbi:MAG: hypothetical protein JSU59_01525 [Nitrospirota bacterium]|nr:MAG: hypothetical protein JSU59_01525 [Nitrospirota bacterium]